MMQLKEKKEMEDQFKKAQKPWATLYARVSKCRLDYHNACKNEKTALNQERNANADSSLSQDQVTWPFYIISTYYYCLFLLVPILISTYYY